MPDDEFRRDDAEFRTVPSPANASGRGTQNMSLSTRRQMYQRMVDLQQSVRARKQLAGMQRNFLARLMSQAGFSIIELAVGVGVGLLIVSIVVPIGINNFVAVDTAGWTGDFATLADIWPLIAIMALLAVALGFVYMATREA